MADPHHADAHDDYVRGSQEISEQESTFDLFMGLAKWGSLLVAVSVLFLVVWFQPGGSFIAGAISGVVLLAVGIFALRKKKSH
ncbi:aa3-type cytochrome c oxidase subunit IV [Roseibacterium beibuensis]|uniref:aa3-type cytochrome c oxidase subunit IV n=1 Tax=[Roseibacterium] beibuensis TaxID=1193142 RepID=UPI00217CE393|nr:aa3-type cytochrome c oxidase subunit IV [Roseibacterium beibuensis]MCS6624782.1 aa3-type cytochrome c oxidase subunit IV [Roseibacterium beibuensis]